MGKFFKILITGIIVSLYFFPFEFSFLKGINTKMILAAIGIIITAFDMARSQDKGISKNIILLFLYASIVSLIGLISVVYNNTPDYAYVSYIVSMAVWFSASYVVCRLIMSVHDNISIKIVSHYLIGVCVAQCALALLIDNIPPFKMFVDSYISQDQEFLNEIERLYGIGAWLDVAGSRFSGVIILAFYIAFKERENLTTSDITLYLLSIAIIVVCGNMISRTTMVGFVIGLGYVLIASRFWDGYSDKGGRRFWVTFGCLIAISSILMVYLYNRLPEVQKLTRFAFEGFFNLVEKGTWKTDSTDKLQTMYVFPESLKTWIIGDGYFVNPNRTDPNYLGEFRAMLGYYMGTDVGYLRFIFYFGLVGLIAFTGFLSFACKVCCDKNEDYKWLFTMILLCGFVVWLKVATDLFLLFALFICVGFLQNEEENVLISK